MIKAMRYFRMAKLRSNRRRGGGMCCMGASERLFGCQFDDGTYIGDDDCKFVIRESFDCEKINIAIGVIEDQHVFWHVLTHSPCPGICEYSVYIKVEISIF